MENRITGEPPLEAMRSQRRLGGCANIGADGVYFDSRWVAVCVPPTTSVLSDAANDWRFSANSAVGEVNSTTITSFSRGMATQCWLVLTGPLPSMAAPVPGPSTISHIAFFPATGPDLLFADRCSEVLLDRLRAFIDQEARLESLAGFLHKNDQRRSAGARISRSRYSRNGEFLQAGLLPRRRYGNGKTVSAFGVLLSLVLCICGSAEVYEHRAGDKNDKTQGGDPGLLMAEPLHTRCEARERCLREARFCARLQHPGIIPVHETGWLGSRPYLAMKLVKGSSLADLLAARPAPDQDLPRFLDIFERVCETVAYARPTRAGCCSG